MLTRADNETEEAWMTPKSLPRPWMAHPDFLLDGKKCLSCFRHHILATVTGGKTIP